MPSKLEHFYGANVNVINLKSMHTLLAELCHPKTFQPRVHQLVQMLYHQLILNVIEEQFEFEALTSITRMNELYPDCHLQTHALQQSQRAVCVNLARAGTFPSHICFEKLHDYLPAAQIRQDHIFASRTTNEKNEVLGTSLSSSKIGGDIEKAYLLIPDPMGATGSTVIESYDHYKKTVQGVPRKVIALNLIVTPEYLLALKKIHPEVIIYCFRVDRGLSPAPILSSPPGLYWSQEKGLTSNSYIVPGGGGFGEIMNNSYV
jgi:uracil phosphoribosyltransferase